MILSFKTKTKKGKPTYFVQKIWNGIYKSIDHVLLAKYEKEHLDKLACEWDKQRNNFDKKLHSIREYRKGKRQWKVGDWIDFYIYSRSENMFRFAPKLKVKSIQKIRIEYIGKDVKVFIDDILIYDEDNFYNKKSKDYRSRYAKEHTEMLKIAQNDGFETIADFFNWFKEDFEGTIIHWTDLKY